jgi:hypothetical protein
LATKGYIDGLVITDHGGLAGLGDDDHTQYSLADGTRDFTGVVNGVTPTLAAHLATKGYVDGVVVTDHGALAGLADDDHTQYTLADGTRAFSGVVSGVTPTLGTHLTTKDYVDNATSSNFYYQDPILDQVDFVTSEPGAPGSGDRYISTTTGSSSGTATAVTANNIYEWNGASWDETIASEGMILYDDTLNRKLCFNGTAWVDAGAGTDHGALSGLGDDDHSQYLLLAGRAGGQSITGGTAASENLTLSSTSNATKGVIINTDAIRVGNTTDTTNGNFRYTGTDFEVRLAGVWTSITQSGITDHGLLTGLGDDDHTQYSLADGTRDFTGVVNGVTPTLAAHLATKGYVDGVVVTDHGGLTGLTDDDHSQYLLLAGRAGGQSITGGTGSGDTLTITSTSDATKGEILFTNGARGVRIEGGNASFAPLTVDQNASAVVSDIFRVRNALDTIIARVSTDGTRDPIFRGDAQAGGILWQLDSSGFETAGFVRPGNTTDTTDGNIRHTGTDMEARISGAWVSLTSAGGVTDHGALTGLADDDHTQYTLADGTRAFTGVVSGVTPTLAAHLATKGYVDGASSAGIDPVMHLVTAGEVTAGFFTLATAPNTAAAVSVTPVGGVKQVNKQIVGATGATPDYDVNVDGASTISINNAGSATGLSGSIVAGNVLIIEYVA